jgi:hypothetical protein
MKTFYEMLSLMEEEQGGDMAAAPDAGGEGLGDQSGPGAEAQPESDPQGEQKATHYMFFSNLKMIKEKVEAMLAMDQSKVDEMLGDGHDWASDHISTSRDDVEEVYNWLAGELGGDAQPQQGGV